MQVAVVFNYSVTYFCTLKEIRTLQFLYDCNFCIYIKSDVCWFNFKLLNITMER